MMHNILTLVLWVGFVEITQAWRRVPDSPVSASAEADTLTAARALKHDVILASRKSEVILCPPRDAARFAASGCDLCQPPSIQIPVGRCEPCKLNRFGVSP